MTTKPFTIVYLYCLFYNPVPNPTIQFSRLPLVSTVYVGLNVSLRCDARVPVSGQLIGVEAVVEWMKEGARLSSSGDGRITLGDLQIDSPGRDYRRSIQFSPLSAGDMATYSCSAMIIPTVDNPRVTNGFGVGNTNLIVVGKTLIIIMMRILNSHANVSLSFSTHFGCLYRSN